MRERITTRDHPRLDARGRHGSKSTHRDFRIERETTDVSGERGRSAGSGETTYRVRDRRDGVERAATDGRIGKRKDDRLRQQRRARIALRAAERTRRVAMRAGIVVGTVRRDAWRACVAARERDVHRPRAHRRRVLHVDVRDDDLRDQGEHRDERGKRMTGRDGRSSGHATRNGWRNTKRARL